MLSSVRRSVSGLHSSTVSLISIVSLITERIGSFTCTWERLPILHSRSPSQSHQSCTLPCRSTYPAALNNGNALALSGVSQFSTTSKILLLTAAWSGKKVTNLSFCVTRSHRVGGLFSKKPGRTRIRAPHCSFLNAYCAYASPRLVGISITSPSFIRLPIKLPQFKG